MDYSSRIKQQQAEFFFDEFFESAYDEPKIFVYNEDRTLNTVCTTLLDDLTNEFVTHMSKYKYRDGFVQEIEHYRDERLYNIEKAMYNQIKSLLRLGDTAYTRDHHNDAVLGVFHEYSEERLRRGLNFDGRLDEKQIEEILDLIKKHKSSIPPETPSMLYNYEIGVAPSIDTLVSFKAAAENCIHEIKRDELRRIISISSKGDEENEIPEYVNRYEYFGNERVPRKVKQYYREDSTEPHRTTSCLVVNNQLISYPWIG